MMWAIHAIVSVLASISVYLFAPFMVLTADDKGYLPHWLAWAGQEDASLDGDIYWQDPAAHPTVAKLPRYVRRVLWLWRNPAQVLDAEFSAFVYPGLSVSVFGNPSVSDQPVFVPGYCYAKVGQYWMLYICLPTFPGMCLRVYLGYKLMDFIHDQTKTDHARLTIGFNPFMTRGKSST